MTDFVQPTRIVRVFSRRTDDKGNCYGTGQIGFDYEEETASCSECGQSIGFIGGSVQKRLARHKPYPTAHRTRTNAWHRAPLKKKKVRSDP